MFLSMNDGMFLYIHDALIKCAQIHVKTPGMRPDMMRTYLEAMHGCLTGFCADFGRYHDTNCE